MKGHALPKEIAMIAQRGHLELVEGPCPEPIEGFVVKLRDALDARVVGAKASNLARLMRIDPLVPDGVVITDAAHARFLAHNDLPPLIAALTTKLDVRCPIGIRSAAETIAALVRDSPLPADVIAALDFDARERLMVRSSAAGEDSREASFAGLLDSVTDVVGAGQMRQAVLRVWASRWSERALTYALARKVSLQGMGVIVQRQIPSSISGVLFTAAPGNDRELLFEYCQGHGEALVAGRENPGRVRISRQDLRWSEESRPDRPVAADQLSRLLNDVQIAGLVRRAREIERVFGSPQDIEWTMDGQGRVWIVQTRPITTVRNPRLVMWSNANVNENFPRPISPLLYSIARDGYYHYFRNLGRAFGIAKRRIDAMEQPLRHIIGVHGGRMYYNLTSIHDVLRAAPSGERLAEYFDQFVGADGAGASSERGHWSGTGRLRQALEIVGVAAKTTWQFMFLTRRVERFERKADAWAKSTAPEHLDGRPRQHLLNDFRGFLEIRNHQWKDASLADCASMVSYGLLQRMLARALPSADHAALHNTLLKALPDMVSARPALELWGLSRLVRGDRRLLDLIGTQPAAAALRAINTDPAHESFKQEFDRFLADWGFRCSGELMLDVPSFQEEPERAIEILKAYVGMDGESPADQLRRQQAERERETERVARLLRSRRPFRLMPFVSGWLPISIVLRCTQRSIPLRERARLKQALLYSRLRHVVLAMGRRLVLDGRLDRPDDIFFLTAGEIDDLASGSAMFPDHVRPLVALRQRAHQEISATTPPDSMTLGVGEYLPALGGRRSALGTDPSGLGGRRSALERERSEAGQELHGLAVCGGTTTGRAAVLSDVSEAERLRPGDVLVTRQTDPGWAAVFPLISGLVMERGGMLSHGAIIAREFGIPSVVGVADATRIVTEGDRVHVDGNQGVVRIEELERATSVARPSL
jgi:pyruvate,water dikinase